MCKFEELNAIAFSSTFQIKSRNLLKTMVILADPPFVPNNVSWIWSRVQIWPSFLVPHDASVKKSHKQPNAILSNLACVQILDLRHQLRPLQFERPRMRRPSHLVHLNWSQRTMAIVKPSLWASIRQVWAREQWLWRDLVQRFLSVLWLGFANSTLWLLLGITLQMIEANYEASYKCGKSWPYINTRQIIKMRLGSSNITCQRSR